MKTIDEWLAEAERHLDLSRGADSTREYDGDLTDAAAAFAEVLALDPRHLGALTAHADLMARLNRHAEAVESFSAALRLQPERADLLVGFGRSKAKLGEHDLALAAFERAGTLPAAWLGRARALTALGRHALAVGAWDAVLAQDPSSLEAKLARAMCLAHLDRAEAKRAFLEAFRAHGPRFDSILSPWELTESLRTLDIAREAFTEHLGPVTDVTALHHAGSVWVKASRGAEAVEIYVRLAALQPDSPQVWFHKGGAHALAGQLPEAIACYRRALELWPEFSGARTQLKLVEQRLTGSTTPLPAPRRG